MKTAIVASLLALLVALAAAYAVASSLETCYSTGERIDGLNKICFYQCPSGKAAITISNVRLCPLSIKR